MTSQLHLAVQSADAERVTQLLAAGADPDEVQDGLRPIERAILSHNKTNEAQQHCAALCAALLDAGAGRRTLGVNKLTPFQFAVYHHVEPVIRAMCARYGEDVQQKTKGGKKLFELAGQRLEEARSQAPGKEKIITLLEEKSEQTRACLLELSVAQAVLKATQTPEAPPSQAQRRREVPPL